LKKDKLKAIKQGGQCSYFPLLNRLWWYSDKREWKEFKQK